VQTVGVVDLLRGTAVHARGGYRHTYVPVAASGGAAIDGDAAALARVYLEQFGLSELYVADLEAILGGAPQADLIRSLVSLGAPVWLDAGVSTVEAARAALDLGVARLVVGLETLPSFERLSRICEAAGDSGVAFSLDLREGIPLAAGDIPSAETPERLAAGAVRAGASAVIVIDVARVGSGRGVDLTLLARVRKAVPGVTLIAGGGIRTIADLERLAAVGCDGALVASALHEGGITAADLAAYV
jgi:phosphoribosylformimino-5-aminoimidazole carboxamide ribotide isomerase